MLRDNFLNRCYHHAVMKVMIIEAKYETEIIIPPEVIKKLPQKVTLAVPVQYRDALQKIIEQLAKQGITATPLKGFHSKYPGQILGCDLVSTAQGSDAFFYVGDGLFHPKTLLLKTEKPVHCYFPQMNEYKIMTKKDVEEILNRQRAAQFVFLNATSIGLLVTTKYGQKNLKAALAIKNWLRRKKKVTLFLADALDWNDLENYPFVDVWVNTMCPRISYDDQSKFRKPVLDLSEAIELLKAEDPPFSFSGLLAAREKKEE